jgi:hypothetical protein
LTAADKETVTSSLHGAVAIDIDTAELTWLEFKAHAPTFSGCKMYTTKPH